MNINKLMMNGTGSVQNYCTLIVTMHDCYRDPRRSAGHGMRHVHQDRAQVQAPLCADASGGGDAFH